MPEKFLGYDVQTLANGLSIAVFGLLTGLGWIAAKWKRPPRQDGQQVEIAGAVIDSREAQKLREGFDAVAAALKGNTVASRDVGIGVASIIAEIKAVRDEMAEANHRLEGIKERLIELRFPKG